MDGPERRGAYSGLHHDDEQSEADLQNDRRYQHVHRAGESSSEDVEDSEILGQGGVGADSTLPRYRSRSTLNHNANGNGSVDMSSQMPAIKAFDFETGARLDSSQSSSSNNHNHDHEMSNASSTTTKVDDSWSSSKPRRVDWSLPQDTAATVASSKDENPGFERPSFNRSMSDYDKDDQGATFDDYDWDDDDELVKQLDERYEQEQKKQREEAHRHGTVIRRFSPVHLAKVVFTTFLGNVILILLLITPAVVVQFLVKTPTSDEHLIYVCDNIQAWCYWVAFNFIARWVIHTAFEVIPRIVVAIIELIWGDSNERFRGWVEVFTASKSHMKPLFFSGFFFGSFAIIFNSIFSLRNNDDPANSRAQYTYRVYQVVELLFFISIVYGIEKILIRIISLRFHAVAYAERLKDNARALSTLDRLKDYKPRKKRAHNTGSYPHTPRSVLEGANHYFSTHVGAPGHRSGTSTPAIRSPLTGGSGSATPPSAPVVPDQARQSIWSRLPLPSSFRSGPDTQDNNIIPMQVTNQAQQQQYAPSSARRERQNSGSASIAPSSIAPSTATTLTPVTPGAVAEALVAEKGRRKSIFRKKRVTAQEIARQAMVDPLKTLQNPGIVKNGLGLDFASPADAKKLARDLFYAFRSSSNRDYLITSDFYPAFPTVKEAEAAFEVFDKDNNGDISRSEIRHTILAAYKERRYLARALQDASTAIGVLDRLFLAVCVFIIALIAFAVFNVNIYSNLTTAYTIAIAVSFIFKSAAQNVFDSVIFLFATHPFDTGDRVVVEEEVFVVKQLGLFSTLFTRWDGTETMIANSKLGSLFITNFRRSPPQFENATLQLGWHTTIEQLDALEARMNEWLQRDEKRMFSPSTSIVLQKFVMQRCIEVTVGMTHRANWQAWGERWDNRTAFHAALIYYTKELGITCYASPQPVQYWQEDLDAEPVYDDDEDLDDLRSPLSPADGTGQQQMPASLAPLQPLMGFLPPEGSNMRRRKGFSRKRNMAGVGA